MSDVIDLPIIVCGEVKYPDENSITLNYANDVHVRIARPTERDLERIYAFSEPLHEIPIQKVASYLTRFSPFFNNPENGLRQKAIELSSKLTGYTREMLERDYSIIAAYLSSRTTSYDTIESELGDCRVLDAWVRRKVARIRAFPRGRALHVLVGNVPLAGIYSVFRSVLTKNQTVVKLPARDLVSTLFFMRGLLAANDRDTREARMLNRSLSAMYHCCPTFSAPQQHLRVRDTRWRGRQEQLHQWTAVEQVELKNP